MYLLGEWYWALLVLLGLVPVGIVFALIRVSVGDSSDHYFHVTQIEKIRMGGHRFLSEIDFFLIKPDMLYPQLVHWALSFFRKDRAACIGTYVSVVFSALSTVMLIGFAYAIHPHLSGLVTVPSHVFVVGALAIYVVTPYSYSGSNAKNLGMSGRAVGLFFAEMYVYVMVLYVLGYGTWLLALAIGVVFLILASGVFSMQFVFLSAPLFAIAYRDAAFLAVPAMGLVLFVVMFRKYAKQYIIGQWYHKTFYSRFLAERFILMKRPSIWRDFVLDFWRIGFGWIRNLRKGTITLREVYRGLDYISENPLVIVLVRIPAMSVFLVVGGVWLVGLPSTAQHVAPFDTSQGLLLVVPVLISLIVFVATSFRWTRFLGEPERYVQVANGVLSVVVAIIAFQFLWLYWALLAVSVVVLSLSLAAFMVRLANQSTSDSVGVAEMRKALDEELVCAKYAPRILSNDIQLAKKMLDERVKIVYGWAMFEIAGLPFREVFEAVPIINPSVIPQLARGYDVDYVLIDTASMPNYEQVFTDGDIDVELIRSAEGLLLFKVRRLKQ